MTLFNYILFYKFTNCYNLTLNKFIGLSSLHTIIAIVFTLKQFRHIRQFGLPITFYALYVPSFIPFHYNTFPPSSSFNLRYSSNEFNKNRIYFHLKMAANHNHCLSILLNIMFLHRWEDFS